MTSPCIVVKYSSNVDTHAVLFLHCYLTTVSVLGVVDVYGGPLFVSEVAAWLQGTTT